MTDLPFSREPIDCARLRGSALLGVYLDGELPVVDTLRVQFHLEHCPACRLASAQERALRRCLRRQLDSAALPRDSRERVQRALARCDWRQRVARPARWLAGGAVAATILVFLVWGVRSGGSEPDLVKDLVTTHRLYSSLEVPAEMVSESRLETGAWIQRQLAWRVPVPDLGMAGLQLLGARLSTHGEHPMVYLFYQKGRVLLSLYVLPAFDFSLPRQGQTTLDGREVVLRESDGHQVLLGRSGRYVFALVSTLDREALIECARAFLREAAQTLARTDGAMSGSSRA